MDWEIITQILLLLASGLFAIGTTIIIAEEKKRKRIKNHIDNLPEKREDGFPFQKPPLTGKGQFDKQRTTYTEGDNT